MDTLCPELPSSGIALSVIYAGVARTTSLRQNSPSPPPQKKKACGVTMFAILTLHLRVMTQPFTLFLLAFVTVYQKTTPLAGC